MRFLQLAQFFSVVCFSLTRVFFEYFFPQRNRDKLRTWTNVDKRGASTTATTATTYTHTHVHSEIELERDKVDHLRCMTTAQQSINRLNLQLNHPYPVHSICFHSLSQSVNQSIGRGWSAKRFDPRCTRIRVELNSICCVLISLCSVWLFVRCSSL